MTTLLGIGAQLPTDRIAAGRGKRARIRPDEDVVTLAVPAAAAALADNPLPRSVVFATTTPPYIEGGSVQPLVELLGLQGPTFACDLNAGDRDGVAAVRLAAGLVAAGDGPVLVVAAQAGRPAAGDGAVALLLGEGDGLAEIRPLASHTEEIRDRWRLRGKTETIESDRSFAEAIGTNHLAHAAQAPGGAPATLINGPHAKAAARLERESSGPGDSVAPAVGDLGAAHPLMRLIVDGGDHFSVLSLAGGQAEEVGVEWKEDTEEIRAAVRAQLDAGHESDGSPAQQPALPDFHPYSSLPRSWREREVDLRLKGILPEGAQVPGRVAPVGTAVTLTVDHVYPGGSPTAMVVVDLAEGGRFFGQVAAGESVAIGDRVRLVPRHLHSGGEVVQYFWKAERCQ